MVPDINHLILQSSAALQPQYILCAAGAHPLAAENAVHRRTGYRVHLGFHTAAVLISNEPRRRRSDLARHLLLSREHRRGAAGYRCAIALACDAPAARGRYLAQRWAAAGRRHLGVSRRHPIQAGYRETRVAAPLSAI